MVELERQLNASIRSIEQLRGEITKKQQEIETLQTQISSSSSPSPPSVGSAPCSSSFNSSLPSYSQEEKEILADNKRLTEELGGLRKELEEKNGRFEKEKEELLKQWQLKKAKEEEEEKNQLQTQLEEAETQKELASSTSPLPSTSPSVDARFVSVLTDSLRSLQEQLEEADLIPMGVKMQNSISLAEIAKVVYLVFILVLVLFVVCLLLLISSHCCSSSQLSIIRVDTILFELGFTIEDTTEAATSFAFSSSSSSSTSLPPSAPTSSSTPLPPSIASHLLTLGEASLGLLRNNAKLRRTYYELCEVALEKGNVSTLGGRLQTLKNEITQKIVAACSALKK
jgi:hypothetical protein